MQITIFSFLFRSLAVATTLDSCLQFFCYRHVCEHKLTPALSHTIYSKTWEQRALSDFAFGISMKRKLAEICNLLLCKTAPVEISERIVNWWRNYIEMRKLNHIWMKICIICREFHHWNFILSFSSPNFCLSSTRPRKLLFDVETF